MIEVQGAMMTALDVDPGQLDPAARQFVETIRQSGWIASHVRASATASSFTYTTGLWATRGMAELIVFGLDMEGAHGAFSAIVAKKDEAGPLKIGAPLDAMIEGRRAALFNADRCKHAEFMPLTCWFYDHPGFPCQQLVLSDPQGVLPWEEGADPAFRELQPDLTVSGWTSELGDPPPA